MHIDEVKNNQFYQFPQWLLKEPYNVLSDKAKLIYMLLFDRRTLSVENKWFDDDGKVYMYFTNEQFMELLKCSNKTVVKAKKELHDLSLLREVRQGINKPNRLYINGSVESTLQDVYKLHTINTNIINTNISNYYDDKGTSFLEEIENLWGRQFNGYEVQQINRFLLEEHISNDLLKKAIETSLANGARNMNYVSAVINNWIDSGITTVEQVDAAQELRLKQKSKTNSKDEEVSEYDTW
ncbi:TPA: replication initiator protein A [Streptococcus pyogenes]|uniref:DnaD domain protein n=4 Tax=Streptococcus pyogenes TaxID=1314 RepID=UPI0000F09364|nr:DnaD domain protein [Streptococcus pyogenes]ESA53272.1 replication initiator protein A, N-terminal domain protein [Streptococcus pyogenes GA40468]QBX28962.1 putative replication protein [Streptococcus phage Javan476]QBX29325.1 putative replication protein [Streptococcus phage Javan492]HER4662127.1 replication initiator protein A [Streptococcus pyogenes NGAS428]HER4781268.1 replication initiator protein A [Streptococcus pyogenes NGAS148]